MPLLGAAYRNVIAILSSLNEITVFVESEKTPLATLEIELEPSVIGLGPKHVAIAMNNRAWFYEITEKTGAKMVSEVEYMSTVCALHLNLEYAVAKLDGRAQLRKVTFLWASIRLLPARSAICSSDIIGPF
ncbi:unnamed protein product [Gongylonema pulchrum]|uniref:ATP-synt_DE_N domain-containing protein n=1 Tax=Gongylonema pulchrum TaxID=637853 RepID=A0A183ET82_9BILA|nr:unnamed protein product [Gongylonema pulchrum]